jgi:serine/threonine-protein kinase
MNRAAFGVAVYPVWSPDGRTIAHTTFEDQVGHLFLRAPDGTARSERLTEGANSRYASSFSPDGTRLLYREEAGDTGLDIGVVTLGPPRRVETLIRTPSNELNPEVSPDGRWLAYESNPSGENEVYVRPFPDVDSGLWQVSSGGGRQPAWSRDGRELFFRAPDGSLMAVSVEAGPRFAVGLPGKVLDHTHYSAGPYRSYDVSADGKRFLLLKRDADTAEAAHIVVVQNWFEELKRLVP